MIERIFAKNLAQKMAEKIHGKIGVKIINDEICVRIQCWTDIDCEIFISDFSQKILNGYSTDYACYEVLEIYQKKVLNRYFK